MTRLTSKQQRVLEYLQRYLTANRRGPYIREIQAGCQITSYKSTVDRLNALERKGYIKRIPNRHRGIRLRNHLVTHRAAPELSVSAAQAVNSSVQA